MINGYRDWLGELQAALATCAAVGVIGAGVAVAYAAFADTVPLTVHAAASVAVTGLPAGVRVAEGGDLSLTVLDPGWAERLLFVSQGAPAYLLGLMIIVVLWRIVRAARRADPFSPELSRRLRRLGVATVVLGLVADTTQWGISAVASTLIYPETWTVTIGYDFWWLLLGFGLLAVAEVLRRGAALRAELDEVV